MLELWDYLVQLAVTAFGFCTGLREYFRTRRQPWFLLTCFYATFALGTLYWLLAILDVTRYGIQSLGFSALSVISGALEMVARILVATIFVPLFGFHAICWTDQAAWVAACCYLIPMLLHLIHKVEREYKEKE